MKPHITHDNVLDDLGFEQAEADNLKIRASLMRLLKRYIEEHQLTQTQAATQLGIDQARISKLTSGRIDLFTIDRLVKMLSRVDIHVELKAA